MKFKSFFFAAIAAVFSFASCDEMGKDPDLGAPAITVSATELSFEEAGGNQTLTLNATRDWKVTSTAEWVVVNPASGKASAADQTVEVSALANEGGNRTANLSFTIGMYSKTVTVTQVGTGVTPPEEGITSIADVLAATGALPANTVIKGIVISNLALNNLTSKKGMYVQDETAGLQFFLGGNHSFAVGTEVKIDLSGVTLGAYNGAVQISGLALDKITQVSTDNALVAKTVTVADFLANKYEGQYIALEGVQVASSDLSKTWVSGGSHTSINMEDSNGNKFVVFSSSYASYGAETVAQGSGTIKGISSINNGNMQIIFAQASDYAGLTGARFEGAEVTPPAGGDDNTGDDNTGDGGNVTPVDGNSDDFVTLTSSRYYEASLKTTNGWEVNNCQVHVYGTGNTNDTFAYVPEGNKAVCMNGKTSAAGKITSPVIAGGCEALSFNYCYPFSEANGVSFKVEILQNDAVVKSFDVVNKTAAKYEVCSHTEQIGVTGNFTIRFTNNSPSNNSSNNKDRYSIWNVTWTSKAE